jgi:hypothetical protein
MALAFDIAQLAIGEPSAYSLWQLQARTSLVRGSRPILSREFSASRMPRFCNSIPNALEPRVQADRQTPDTRVHARGASDLALAGSVWLNHKHSAKRKELASLAGSIIGLAVGGLLDSPLAGIGCVPFALGGAARTDARILLYRGAQPRRARTHCVPSARFTWGLPKPDPWASQESLTRRSRNQEGCRGSSLQTPGFRKNSSWSLGSGAWSLCHPA